MATPEQIARFNEVYQLALEAGDPHPQVVAAQWAIESGWGKKQSGVNNMFGIKAGNGDPNSDIPGTNIMTHEVVNGKRVPMLQKFRDYETKADSVADRVAFTRDNPRYAKAGYNTAANAAEAAMSLQNAGYATDPNYANMITSVIKSAKHDPYAQ